MTWIKLNDRDKSLINIDKVFLIKEPIDEPNYKGYYHLNIRCSGIEDDYYIFTYGNYESVEIEYRRLMGIIVDTMNGD